MNDEVKLSDLENSVKERYAKGAEKREEALCCPVQYNPEFLKVIPQEILDKDYGCGDPSEFLKRGDVVLDLGAGGGKICYIASQIVGEEGKVIGVDFNPVMIRLAKKYQQEIAEKIGWDNIEFKWGRIQDLKTDLTVLESKLQQNPIKDVEAYLSAEAQIQKTAEHKPLVESHSIDVIVSNCVLNLVKPEAKHELFKEMFRVLKKGGRVAISDIVSDEKVPQHLQDDEQLWSGCISGAFQEKDFVQAFEKVGFYGVKIEKRDQKPWKTVEGIEFRSVTITAYKGKEGPCLDFNQAVIYKGPWKQVCDDDGHLLKRGEWTAVCEKTFNIYSKAPYQDQFYFLEPYCTVAREKALLFDCRRNAERSPKEIKGDGYFVTNHENEACESSGCC